MNEYTKQELEEAKTALASTLHKCEKIRKAADYSLQDRGTGTPSYIVLMTRSDKY